MSEIRILKTNKNKEMLGVDGYFYYLERITKQRTYNWSCSKRIACHCKSRLVTELKDGIHCVIKRSGVHTHSPEAVEGFVRDANIKLKELSKKTCLPASQIIRETIVLTTSDSRDALPSKMAQKSKIMRTRKKKWNMKEPKTVDDIDMPLNLYLLEGELFVLAEKWVDDEFFIILGTKSSLEMLSSSDCWAVDGTFHVVPRVMRQLFSIHGRVHGEIVPLVFCLMSKKTLKSYVAVFNELLTIAGNHELNLCPQRIICDFEMGIISAIKQCFPNTDLRGCLFHFGQLIWRKVQKERLAQKYGTSVEFALQVRMIKSLAFVPPSEIPNYFQTLLNNCDDESVKNLLVWFDKNYIDINNNNSKYSPEFWSVHDHNASQTETFPRTQNNIEAWHRRLKVIVGRRNSQFYHLVLSLQKELILAKTQISRKENGERVRKKRKIIKKNKQLRRIIKKRNELSHTTYLKRIAKNIVIG